MRVVLLFSNRAPISYAPADGAVPREGESVIVPEVGIVVVRQVRWIVTERGCSEVELIVRPKP